MVYVGMGGCEGYIQKVKHSQKVVNNIATPYYYNLLQLSLEMWKCKSNSYFQGCYGGGTQLYRKPGKNGAHLDEINGSTAGALRV